MKRLVILSFMLAFVCPAAFGQAPACPSGTLANVIGTSCTIGNLTFNFQNNFQGSVRTVSSADVTVPVPPNAIGFTPMQSGDHAGFLLTTNFVDNGNGTGLSFTQHNITFSYSVQVNGAFEILGESAQVVGSIADVTPSSQDAFFAFDGQCFTNGQCMAVQPINQPSASAILGIPGLASTGVGAPFTTEVDSFAVGGGEATLTSVQFLYSVVPQTPLPPPARLHYKNIDLPGEQNTFVGSINNRGQVAGTFTDFSGASHGYVSDRDGDKVTTVDFPGATFTAIAGINDQGDVVGEYVDSVGVVHGFALQDGSFSTIDFPGSIFNVAQGINDRGQIVGLFQNADTSIHGYLLQDGNFTRIDDPNAFVTNSNGASITVTEMSAINNRGDMVGFSTDRFGFLHGFLLEDEVFHRIDVPAAVEGTGAFGLNDREQVVGDFTDINVKTHGFLLSHSVFSTVDFPGGGATEAFQINSRGQIVGVYTDNTGVFHSFLAERRDSNLDSTDNKDVSDLSPGHQTASPEVRPPASRCVIRQPMHPVPTTGLLTCNPIR